MTREAKLADAIIQFTAKKGRKMGFTDPNDLQEALMISALSGMCGLLQTDDFEVASNRIKIYLDEQVEFHKSKLN